MKSLTNDRIEIDYKEISPETEEILHYVHNKRKQAMDDFEQQSGIHLLIEGNITAASFDPMNIVAFEEKLLHQTFLQVSINNTEYLIEQPVLAYGHLHKINKLHVVIKNYPTENVNGLVVDGIGEIQGRYWKQGNVFYLHAN